MAITAEPLSYLWTVKEAKDFIRSITGEFDEQIVTDDNIEAYLQSAIMQAHKLFPAIRDEYAIDIPFVDDSTANPATSTIPPASAQNKNPYKIIAGDGVPVVAAGIYPWHYENPTNFRVLGWLDLWNDQTGTCRRTSDFTQLMGICLGNNTQLSKTVAWTSKGRNLWVSVREKMNTGTIVHGIAVRTVIPIIQLTQAGVTAETSIPTDDADTTLDETTRAVTDDKEYQMLDCPDDYFPILAQVAATRVWGQIKKEPAEQIEANVNAQFAQLMESMEQSVAQREDFRKAKQWNDRGHL